MPPRNNWPICVRSFDLILIGIGRRAIPQYAIKHLTMQMFYRTSSDGRRPSRTFTSRRAILNPRLAIGLRAQDQLWERQVLVRKAEPRCALCEVLWPPATSGPVRR